MQLNPAEISELIKSRIEGLAASADIRNQGTVISVTDGIVRVQRETKGRGGKAVTIVRGVPGDAALPRLAPRRHAAGDLRRARQAYLDAVACYGGDYSVDELMAIADLMLAKQQYAFDDQARATFRQYLERRD